MRILIEDQYWDEFEYWEGYTPWLEVVSNSPDKAFDEIMAQIQDEGPSPTPFLGCTIEEIYDFFKAHLRPPDDSVALEHFTSFTFTVIDAECVLSHPQQCIICCDAPDFGEADDEIKLKQLRLPLQEWSHTVGGLELLRRTPSEIESQAPMVIATMPPPELVPIPDKPGLYRIATPAESRVARKRAIRVVEEADIVS